MGYNYYSAAEYIFYSAELDKIIVFSGLIFYFFYVNPELEDYDWTYIGTV